MTLTKDSGDQIMQNWPWDRIQIAKIVEAIGEAKPAALGIDIVFSHPTLLDSELAKALQSIDRVALATEPDLPHKIPTRTDEEAQPADVLLGGRDRSMGMVSYPIFDQDDTVRRVSVAYEDKSHVRYPTLPMLLAEHYRASHNLHASASISDSSGDPVEINFRGPAGTFRSFPSWQVANGMVPKDVFKDAIVILGATNLLSVSSIPLTYVTPFVGSAGRMYDPELLANAVDTLVANDAIQSYGTGGAMLIAIVGIAAVLGFLFGYLPRGGIAVTGIVFSVLYFGAWFAAFAAFAVHLPGPSVVLSFLAGLASAKLAQPPPGLFGTAAKAVANSDNMAGKLAHTQGSLQSSSNSHKHTNSMEYRSLASLAIRLVGFFELVVAFNAVPTFVSNFLNESTRRAYGTEAVLIGGAIGVGMPIVLGLFLIYFPGLMTAKVLRIDGLDSRDPADRTLLESVAIGAMGLWFSVNAIVTAFHQQAWIIGYSLVPGPQRELVWDFATRLRVFSDLLTEAIQFVIGVWLLLGNKGLARALSRLRARGAEND